MNKKEISEIKKQFTPEICSITRIRGCYVDAEKNIKLEMKEAFLSLPEEDMFKYFEILRKGLSGKIGKNLFNMEFPKDAEKEDGAQEFLLRLRDSRLKNEDLINDFYEHVIDTYDYAGNYLILLVHGIYDIPGKTSDGIEMEDASDEVYSYIMCCICPVELSNSGLGYNEQKNTFQHQNREWIVRFPETAFLFPAFNGRSTDIHSALMYAKKRFDHNFIREVLGCNTPLEPEDQKSAFNELVENVFGLDCTCQTVKTVYENLNDMMEEAKDFHAPLSLDKESVKKLFESSGADDECMKTFDALYDNLVCDGELVASNLTDGKIFKIRLPEATVMIDESCMGSAEVRMIDGRKCLVIGISGDFEVNGIKVER